MSEKNQNQSGGEENTGNPDPIFPGGDPIVPPQNPNPVPVPEELRAQILSEVNLVTRVENGQQIEEVTIPESLFSNFDMVTVCQIKTVLSEANPNDHILDFIKGFSPTSLLYPMKLVRNVDNDEFEIVKLPENTVWVRGSWTGLQNPNQLP